jgi:tetratricopeptide (TPR) repeat protein
LLTSSIGTSASAKPDLTGTVQSLRAQAISFMADQKTADPVYFQEGYEKAVRCYEKAIDAASAQYGANSSYLATLNFELGNLYYKGGNFEKAGQYFIKAVEIAPYNQSMRLRLAKFYRQHGDEYCRQHNEKEGHLVKAIIELNKIVRANPGCLEAKKEYSLCWQEAHQPIKAAKAAATLTPHTVQIAKSRVQHFDNLATADPSLFQQALNFGQAVGVSAMGALHQTSPVYQHRDDEEKAKKAKEELEAADRAEKAERARKEQEARDRVRRQQEQEQQEREREKRLREKEDKNAKLKSKSKKETGKHPVQTPATNKHEPASQPEPTEQTTTLKTTARTIKEGEKNKEGEKKESATEAKSEAKEAKAAKPSKAGLSAVGGEKPAAEEKVHESSVSENEPAKPKETKFKSEPAPQAQMPPIVMPAVSASPADSGKKGAKHGRVVLVPPPPPSTPVMPFIPMGPPPGMVMPAPAPAPKPKPPKPKPAAKETPKDSDDTATAAKATPPTGSNEDPDFLIDWGGSGKKKKK